MTLYRLRKVCSTATLKFEFIISSLFIYLVGCKWVKSIQFNKFCDASPQVRSLNFSSQCTPTLVFNLEILITNEIHIALLNACLNVSEYAFHFLYLVDQSTFPLCLRYSVCPSSNLHIVLIVLEMTEKM